MAEHCGRATLKEGGGAGAKRMFIKVSRVGEGGEPDTQRSSTPAGKTFRHPSFVRDFPRTRGVSHARGVLH